MARTPTERLLQQQIQTLFPRLARHRRRALSRRVVGAFLAGSANGPALALALATTGIARAATLADAWDAWIATPAHPSTSPTRPRRVRRRWSVRWRAAPPCSAGFVRWTGGLLAPGLDASHRRNEVVLVRIRIRYRGAALPVVWVIVLANQPGAWEPHGERMLRWDRSALPRDQEVLTLADQGLGSPRLWHAIRSQQVRPIMRVAPRRPSRRPVRGACRCCAWRLDRGMGHGWVGVGGAFTHAPKQIADTLAVAWVAGHETIGAAS